jgi:predicted nucleic acid-binding protein
MAVLTDTNIFLRLLQPHHPHCHAAEQAPDLLRSRGEELNVTSQNLIEFWAVATRPMSEDGLGLGIEEAGRKLDQIKRLWSLVAELPLAEEWERIVRLHGVLGKNTHDARLVAAMHVHGIESILTFNARDFVRYQDITVLEPAKIS